MGTISESAKIQLFIIDTLDLSKCSRTSFNLQCNENELIYRLYEHFKIPIDRYKPIAISTLIEWLHEENIMLQIFDNNGNKIHFHFLEPESYPKKYVVNDKFGNIIEILPGQIGIKEYLIKSKEYKITEYDDIFDNIHSVCEKIWLNNARWSIFRLSDMEPLCVTALNLN